MIQQVISDFYHCTGLAIRYLTQDFTVVHELGEGELITDLQWDLPQLAIGTGLTYEGNSYVAVPHENKGYFVAGPFQSACLLKNQYRPTICNFYFRELLELMIREHAKNDSVMNPYIKKSLDYINKNYQEPLSLTDMCDYLDLNMCYFCTLFKSETGTTFNQYVNKVRIEASMKLLVQTDDSIIDIAMSVGFNNQSYFTLTFKKFAAMAPSLYRAKHKTALS